MISALRFIWPPQLAGGVDRFSNGVAPLLRERFGSADAEHSPHTMLLTCADARILPNLLTDSAPGELLNVRNIGNLVPTGATDASVESALSYALERLNVHTVVVCGHSGCEAMHDLLHGGANGAVGRWLEHGEAALAALRDGHPVARAAAEAGFDEADQLSVVNVATQVQTLREHPLVDERVGEESVTVAGLFLDLRTARLYLVGAADIAEINPGSTYVDGLREVAR